MLHTIYLLSSTPFITPHQLTASPSFRVLTFFLSPLVVVDLAELSLSKLGAAVGIGSYSKFAFRLFFLPYPQFVTCILVLTSIVLFLSKMSSNLRHPTLFLLSCFGTTFWCSPPYSQRLVLPGHTWFYTLPSLFPRLATEDTYHLPLL